MANINIKQRRKVAIIRIETDIELFTAALTQASVTVCEEDGSIADYGGPIERYTPDSVKIGGAYYVRASYEFHVKEATK